MVAAPRTFEPRRHEDAKKNEWHEAPNKKPSCPSCLRGSTFSASSRRHVPERRVDIGRGQPPDIVEMGDDLAHEAFISGKGRPIIAEIVSEQRKGKLRRSGALIGPFEPG